MWLFIKTTVTLIAVCILGVTSVIDNVEVLPVGLRVSVPMLDPCAATFGGVVFDGGISQYELMHECGHLVQEQRYGAGYEPLVAIPSLISASLVALNLRNRWRHLRMPFELEATRLGQQIGE